VEAGLENLAVLGHAGSLTRLIEEPPPVTDPRAHAVIRRAPADVVDFRITDVDPRAFGAEYVEEAGGM
jgi:hypothetical protein